MKLKLLCLSITAFSFLHTSAQDIKAFAITGQSAKNFIWTDIRQVNLTTGNIEKVLFENGISKFNFTNVLQNTPVLNLSFQPQDLTAQHAVFPNQASVSPTMLMSAAAAYDKKHERLFFATMRSNQLVWLDLSDPAVTPQFFTADQFLLQNPDPNDERYNITRMTIGADGNGYAITNDGSHVIKFVTGRKVVVSDMGSLLDATSNNGISIHNQCSSWGGDIVADAFGKLYLFTATKNVFEIDPNTLIATYKGIIQTLPPAFTLNGAAVIDDENVMVSSANTFEGFYAVNIKTLAAKKFNAQGQIFNASDLASSNLLFQGEKQNSVGSPDLSNLEASGNRFISVYPNPVKNNQFKLSFEHNPAGKYRVDIVDLQGRLIDTRTIYVKLPGQTEQIRLQQKQAAGLYTIKVMDSGDKIVYSDKLVID